MWPEPDKAPNPHALYMRPATKEQRLAQERRKEGKMGEKKIEEPLSGLIWQMQSRKRADVQVGVEKHADFFFSHYYISLDADLSD